MADYIDRALTVDASRTRARLGWQPRERLHLTRRLPFLLENYRTDPAEWHQRNRAAMKQARQRPNLLIHRLLERHEEEINRRFTAALLDPDNADRFPDYATLRRGQHDWNHRLALRHLLNAVRTRDRQVFMGYCGDLAAHRGRQGYAAAELCDALEELERICRRVLAEDPDAAEVVPYLHVHLTTTVTFGCDRVIEVFEDAEWREARGIRSREGR